MARLSPRLFLLYIRRVSEPLRRCLEQQGILTIFKSDTTLRSHLVRPEDTVDPAKQDDVVHRIPCKCGKVYIGSRDGAVVRALASHQCGLGWIPGLGVICGLSLLLVLVLTPRFFSPGTPVFHPFSKTNISKFLSHTTVKCHPR